MDDELCHCIAQVVRLHGGELAASTVGDELRRRRPELWRRWKARGSGSADGGAHVGPDLQIRDRGQSRLPEQDGEAVIELLVVDFV